MSGLDPGNGLRALVDFGWRFPPGPHNAITDVPGVRVGHATMSVPDRGVCTGVTVIDPGGDPPSAPLPAAVHVINGYGKSTGLIQVAELGELETPIALTGVFGVGSVLDAFVRRLMARHPSIGDEVSGRSVNAIVMECNDSYLHDPRAAVPGDRELAAAFDAALAVPVERGTVGAGAGMGTFGFAGGIGTASRIVDGTDGGRIGALVLTNFGTRTDLLMAGRPVGRLLARSESAERAPVETRPGSVIVVLATDLALDPWRLRRLARRAQNGLARTGCPTAHGSGEIVLAFSTARAAGAGVPVAVLDGAFRAVAECVEEAVLDSLCSARRAAGRAGRVREPLPVEVLPRLLAHGGGWS